MKSLLLAARSLAALALAQTATADPQTDEANRQRQMASLQAEAARNDQEGSVSLNALVGKAGLLIGVEGGTPPDMKQHID